MTTISNDTEVICLKSHERIYDKCQELYFPHHNFKINCLNHGKEEKKMSRDKNVLIDLVDYLLFPEHMLFSLTSPFYHIRFYHKAFFPLFFRVFNE